MNPNYNRDPETNLQVPLNSTMANHAIHVWKYYVRSAGFKNILIIAHSAGGFCLEKIQLKDSKFFYENVKKIAITDSMVINKHLLNQSQKTFMRENCVHYIKSKRDLGTQLRRVVQG